MILKRSDLVMIRKGQRWFRTPKLTASTKPGKVMWLRSPKHEEASRIELQVTVETVMNDGAGYRVVFIPGDVRPERRYIAAGWPDYCSDPFRAMPDELPPFPETAEERKERRQWHHMGGWSY